jgi:hypothetical protein
MQHHFPLRFTLESGTVVVVDKIEENQYRFLLTTTHGLSDNFTFVDDNRSKDEIEEPLDFDQLNALRVFWLKKTEVV